MDNLKVRLPIDVLPTIRTEEAESRLRQLDQKLQTRMGGSGIVGQPGTASGAALSALQNRLGQDFSFVQNRRTINALIRQEHQSVRDLTEQYDKLRKLKDADGLKQAETVKQQISSHRSLAQAMRSVQMVGENAELARGGAMPALRAGQNVSQMRLYLSQMTLNQALHGAAFTGGAGGLGRIIMSNPYLAGMAAAIGGPVLAYHMANRFAEPAEQINLQYLNASRRMGAGPSLQPGFSTPGNEGRAHESMLRLGFTHRDVARTLSAYGIPGADHVTTRAVEEQLRFARRFGFGGNPDMIAGLGRHVSIMGLDPSQQHTFWRKMAGVNLHGQTFSGVDAQDTTKGMMNLLAKIADNTGLLTPERVTAAMIQMMQGGNAGRIFQGERGMERFSSMMGAFENPQSLQGQALINNILMQSFKGQLPAGQELGLSGGRAEAFNALVPTQKLAFLRQNMTSLPGGIANKIFSGLDKSIPKPLQALVLQSMTGLNESQLVEHLAGLGNMTQDAGRRPFNYLASIYDPMTILAGRLKLMHSANAPYAGQTLTEASKIEQAQATSETYGQELSGAVSRGTLDLRLAIKQGFEDAMSTTIVNTSKLLADPKTEIKLGVLEALREAMGALPFGGFLNDSSVLGPPLAPQGHGVPP